jgi:hypothetical protein
MQYHLFLFIYLFVYLFFRTDVTTVRHRYIIVQDYWVCNVTCSRKCILIWSLLSYQLTVKSIILNCTIIKEQLYSYRQHCKMLRHVHY